MSKCHKSSK